VSGQPDPTGNDHPHREWRNDTTTLSTAVDENSAKQPSLR
jgi:hypothetical protein